MHILDHACLIPKLPQVTSMRRRLVRLTGFSYCAYTATR